MKYYHHYSFLSFDLFLFNQLANFIPYIFYYIPLSLLFIHIHVFVALNAYHYRFLFIQNFFLRKFLTYHMLINRLICLKINFQVTICCLRSLLSMKVILYNAVNNPSKLKFMLWCLVMSLSHLVHH
jgi:hypothetical protein